MSQSHQRLKDLIQLAREPSSERRRELLRKVTDIFLDEPGSFSDHETEHLTSIMAKVALEMEMQVRKDLSERLSTESRAPRQVVKLLAVDEIDVARPLLEKSCVLTNEDLLEMVKKVGQDHLHAISARPEVSEEVTDALVEKGNRKVLKNLVSNKGASFSRRTMERVVARSEEMTELQEPLVQRPDLPADMMHEMFWFVSRKLRNQILESTADIDPETVDRLLTESEQALSKIFVPPKATLTPAEEFIERQVELRQLNEALLVQLLREGRLPELVCGFSRLVGIAENTSRRIIMDKSGEGLAIACKASRFDRSTFSTFILLNDPERTRDVNETYELLSLYDRITVETAQRTMRFWKVRRQANDARNATEAA